MSVVAKVVVIVVAIVGVAVVSGVTGLSFVLWPTSLGDQPLAITPQVLDQLAALKRERKFDADRDHFYFGASSEVARAQAQTAVDDVIQSLLNELPNNPRRAVVLRTFKNALSSFRTPETEERDQFLVYLERVMKIIGMSSSGELFNVWRYGFPYGWFRSA